MAGSINDCPFFTLYLLSLSQGFHEDYLTGNDKHLEKTQRKQIMYLYTVGERELSLYPLKFQQPSLRNELTEDRLTGKNHFNYLYPQGTSTKYETRERSDDLSL